MKKEKERLLVTAESVAKSFGLPKDLVGRGFRFTSETEGILNAAKESVKVKAIDVLTGTITGMRLVSEKDSLNDARVNVYLIIDTDRIEKGYPVIIRAQFFNDNTGRARAWQRVIQMGWNKPHTVDTATDMAFHVPGMTIEEFQYGEFEIL